MSCHSMLSKYFFKSLKNVFYFYKVVVLFHVSTLHRYLLWRLFFKDKVCRKNKDKKCVGHNDITRMSCHFRKKVQKYAPINYIYRETFTGTG